LYNVTTIGQGLGNARASKILAWGLGDLIIVVISEGIIIRLSSSRTTVLELESTK